MLIDCGHTYVTCFTSYVVHSMKGLEATEPSYLPGCNFFYLQDGGVEVKHYTKPFVEYCGNEALPGCIESVYVQRAFIVSQNKKKKKNKKKKTSKQEEKDKSASFAF
jgi:hypothetical protein